MHTRHIKTFSAFVVLLVAGLAWTGCDDSGDGSQGVDFDATVDATSTGPDGAPQGEDGTSGPDGTTRGEDGGTSEPDGTARDEDGGTSGPGGADAGGDAVVPVLDESVVTLLDDVPLSLSAGLSETQGFTAPADTVALTITVDGDPGDMYVLDHWVGPDDFALVPPGWRGAGGGFGGQICFPDCNNRVAASEGSFAAMAPNNPASRADAGEHAFAVHGVALSGFQGSPSNATVRVSVHAVVGTAVPDEATLDLNIHLTGAGGWTADSAPDDTDFQVVLEELEVLYEQVDVSLGEVHLFDIDESFQVIQTIQGADSDLMQMFSSTADNPARAVNLFLVDEIRSPLDGGGGSVLGIAGGIPGPVLRHGAWRSGVAVMVNPPAGGPTVGQVVAHELGHYLGLFHTTENFSLPGVMPEHDPLDDTQPDDASYLMHAAGAGTTLSPWQGRIMRQNPWTRTNQEAR